MADVQNMILQTPGPFTLSQHWRSRAGPETPLWAPELCYSKYYELQSKQWEVDECRKGGWGVSQM